jgi:hypothetical protein
VPAVPMPTQSTATPPVAAAPDSAAPAPAAPAVRPKPAAVAAASAAGRPKVKAHAPDATPHPKPGTSSAAVQPAASPPASTLSTAPVPAAASAPPPPASAPPPAAPPLDLAALKQRLRDTSAIGVFTKLALKNQVDDLLNKFREFYRGQVKITLPELRQSYELLVQKVLALLQDSDPPLAKEITASREAIWGLLADPQKFATL